MLTLRLGQPQALAGFIVTWLLMMTAMMLPSVAPVAILWLRSLSSKPTAERVWSSVGFLSGYVAVWGSFGVVAYLPSVGLMRLEDVGQLKWMGAAVFVIAGVYQLTPLKAACLRQCRSPMALLLKYSSYKGRFRNLKVGIHHGAYCLGCCWGLMAILVLVAAMSPLVMAIIAVGVLLEKIADKGELISRIFGILLLILGAVVAVSSDAAMLILLWMKTSM